MSADEYQAIARKVAEDIGIEQFDERRPHTRFGIAFGVRVRPHSVAVDNELGNDRMNPRISRIYS